MNAPPGARYNLIEILKELQELSESDNSPFNEWETTFIESNHSRIVERGYANYSDKQWDKTIALWEKHCDKAIHRG